MNSFHLNDDIFWWWWNKQKYSERELHWIVERVGNPTRRKIIMFIIYGTIKCLRLKKFIVSMSCKVGGNESNQCFKLFYLLISGFIHAEHNFLRFILIFHSVDNFRIYWALNVMKIAESLINYVLALWFFNGF